MDIRGSRTEKNLYKTFAGESRARNKYTFFAEQARCEGYRWISDIFEETANNEKAHAREAFKRYLNLVGSTEENLIASANGELEEANKLYKEFEEVAREEGFEDIAHFYKELREVEEEHFKRFSILIEKMKKNQIFKDPKENTWRCLNCGYIYEGTELPEHCPLCKYPKSYFKQYCKDEGN